ncbi:Mannosylfructose-phosphate synthase [Caloramator mitchellensis]|uniref:sucrose-phosphate synthase n=1 Tax=Caloramator mitchellensis TaxID=908809 RepID=A0A0R3K0H8_CALMK|nr:glycosyltransferase [Caloramator mitchellensis]KRQ86370.1 Mannosylfructose-phosphate synthase [Caloramator mitchellensis]
MLIAFLNPQGNFDNNDSHWTEHPDFGGQLVYVKEVALALGEMGVKVDIITRRIIDEDWPEFSKDVEIYHGNENVRVVRIPFGGDKFLPKEKLWPYLENEFVDGIIDFYKKEGKKCDALTGHYGDGGLTAAVLSEKWGIPFTFTAHSLGAQKMDKLGVNKDNIEEFDKRYNFTKRIEAERIAMNKSLVNIVSTEQERFSQYSHPYYKGAVDVNDDNRFKVIPPGVNTDVFTYKEQYFDSETKEYINNYLIRDLNEDRINLPCIVLSSRFDRKKNHKGAVLAFAKDKALQQKSNLVIVLRGVENPFENYSSLNKEEKEIMDEIMEIIKEYNLYGKVSMFPINGQKQLASAYRCFSQKGSVFCLTALYEPFGLAPIEAMYAGLPAVVTKNGGTLETVDNGKYGVVVDPENPVDIAKGLHTAIDNFAMYRGLGIKRVEEKYTWRATAKGYLEIISSACNFVYGQKHTLV